MEEKKVYWEGETNIAIEFPYDAELVELVHKIPDPHWDGSRKIWWCPFTSLPEVVELLEPEGFHIPEELKRIVPKLKGEDGRVRRKIAFLSSSGKIFVKFPRDDKLNKIVKAIPDRKWDPSERVWYYPLARLPDIIEVLEPQGFYIPGKLKKRLPEARKEREKLEQERIRQRRVTYSPHKKQILIRFLPNPELKEYVKEKIPKCRWDSSKKTWRCPLASLPEVVEYLEPKKFSIPEDLKGKMPQARKEREKVRKQEEKTQAAENKLYEKIEQGEEFAFLPSANSTLTRRLKKRGAYETVQEEGYFGQQTAGIIALEKDLVEVLAEMGVATDPEARLSELLSYTWHVNTQAKKRRFSSRQYRYLKKGYLLDELCRLAKKQKAYKWGWKTDPQAPGGAEWVLYFQREDVQCSFHSFERGEGPDFDGEWDGVRHKRFPFRKFLPQDRPPLFRPRRSRKKK